MAAEVPLWLLICLAVTVSVSLARDHRRLGTARTAALTPTAGAPVRHNVRSRLGNWANVRRRGDTSCRYHGVTYRCSMSIMCLFTGGVLTTACGQGLSCCRPQRVVVTPSGRRRGRGLRFGAGPLTLTQARSVGSRVTFSPTVYRLVFSRRPHAQRSPSGFRQSRLLSATAPVAPVRHQLLPANSADIAVNSHRIDNELSSTDEEETFRSTQCGRPAPFLSKRIIGGHEAGYGELPWQAHIRILGYQCGGVVVDPSHIVTAAHCVHKAKMTDIKVHLGEYDTKDTGFYPEPYPSEVRSVVSVSIHPHFHYMLTQPDRFDVAVLRLNRPVEYRPNILPICLPSEEDDFTGYTAVVAGWGKTDNTFSKTGTNILNKAPVPIINNVECLRWHFHKHIELQLHTEMFCAGHEAGQRDACLGDSGGPLIVLKDQRWTLAGITSAGFGCAIDHQPGIYHKVSTSAGWIRQNIGDR